MNIFLCQFACGFPEVNWILCFSEGSIAGTIKFFPKGQVSKSTVGSSQLFPLLFYLNYEIDRYQEIIETFRFVKPIYIYILG